MNEKSYVYDNQVDVKGKARLFKNPILEALSKTSPALTLVAYTPVVIACLYYASRYQSISIVNILTLFVIGLLSWTLLEYLIHRFLFHFISENKYIRKFHYMVHGVHHNYPKDEGRLFMPPLPGYIMIAILFSFFYLILGTFAFSFFGGFITGYLAYVFTHYSIHKFKKPKNALGYMWDHHNLHHFKYPEKAFGVSSPLWDYVFGTMPPRRKS